MDKTNEQHFKELGKAVLILAIGIMCQNTVFFTLSGVLTNHDLDEELLRRVKRIESLVPLNEIEEGEVQLCIEIKACLRVKCTDGVVPVTQCIALLSQASEALDEDDSWTDLCPEGLRPNKHFMARTKDSLVKCL